MNYQNKLYQTSQTKGDPKSNYKNVMVHTQNHRVSQYYHAQKEDPSIESSPHSSHSINTPLKFTSNSSSTVYRPTSKELTSSNKSEQYSYSRFSNKILENPAIPLEKSLNIENNYPNNPNNNSKFFGQSTINSKNIKPPVEEEQKFSSNLYNFKKKEESQIYAPNESIIKPPSEKQDFSNKKYQFPYQSKVKNKREMAGLRNIGNTCFLNSTLQCLFNTPQFSDFFLDGEYTNQVNSKNEKGVAEEFARLLKRVRGPKSYSAESTHSLKSALSKFSSKFSGYDQEDAQEFLITLLQGLVNDLNRVKIKPKYKELDDNLNNNTLQNLSNDWFNYFRKFDDSIVNDYFEGQLLSELKCQNCNKISRTFDNFFDISLSFTRGLKMVLECDLERLIEHFTREEKIEEDSVICSKCKKTSFTKKLTFWRLPRILVIHLKRFNYGRFRRDKLDNAVKFPLKDLDLSQFLTESNDQSIKDCCLYDCFGIVNHSGSLYGGHYTSESMNPYDKKWYKYNDDYVSEIYNMDDKNYKNYGSGSAYLLFYAKKIIF